MKKFLPIIIIVTIALGGAYFVLNTVGRKFTEKGLERVIEKSGGEGVDVDISGDNKTIVMEKDGQKVEISSDNKIPSDFPKSISIYPGSKVTGSTEVTAEGQSGTQLALTTKDSVEKVYDYYLAQLPDNGWEIGTKFLSSGVGTVLGQQGDTFVTITTTSSDGTTTIGIFYTFDAGN